jgi:hypothetical protein
MNFTEMKLLLMKLLYLITLPNQQFCLCDTLFNVHDTLMKHALRLASVSEWESTSFASLQAR